MRRSRLHRLSAWAHWYIDPWWRRVLERLGWKHVALITTCPTCEGSGFSGYGSGYGDVCGTCGGDGAVLVDWRWEWRPTSNYRQIECPRGTP